MGGETGRAEGVIGAVQGYQKALLVEVDAVIKRE